MKSELTCILTYNNFQIDQSNSFLYTYLFKVGVLLHSCFDNLEYRRSRNSFLTPNDHFRRKVPSSSEDGHLMNETGVRVLIRWMMCGNKHYCNRYTDGFRSDSHFHIQLFLILRKLNNFG